MKRILLSAVILSSIGIYAQNAPEVKTSNAVGIETTAPRATLDVNGDARLQKVEEMTTSVPTEEKFPNCPCVLTIDKFGVIKRIPSDKFMMKDGSTVNPGGPATPTPTPGTGGNNNVAEIGGNASAATIDNKTDYVVSLIYNGTTYQGKIDNSANKITVKIPYSGGNGQAYQSVTATTQTEAGANQDSETATKPIKMKVLPGTMSGDGFITAEITTEELFKVKMLPPDGVPLKVAEFKLKVGNQTKTVTVNAIGGIPDRKFNEGDSHKFIYLPVTITKGSYTATWLNQNLGADYAKVDGGHFSPNKVGGDDKQDYKAYGSLFQFGRDSDGHELVNWSNSTTATRAKPDVDWKSSEELATASAIDPCPKGYHTPSESEWIRLHVAITGSRYQEYSNEMLNDTNLKLAPAGYNDGYNGNTFKWPSRGGNYWSKTRGNGYTGKNMNFSSSRSEPNASSSTFLGYSIRCIKDN